MKTISPIVEGHGEVEALPILIRRIATELLGTNVLVQRPLRAPKDRLVRVAGELERYVEYAALTANGGAVLVVLDADKDCPAELGPALLERAKAVHPQVDMSVAVAVCEYEAWFLASLSSLSGGRGFPDDLQDVENPESIRGAKEKLRKLTGCPYSETTDQPALTARFDLVAARGKAPSLDRLCREVGRLLTTSP